MKLSFRSHVGKAIDDGNLEWQYVVQHIQKNLDNENKILETFNRV
jgi:hypothetical protein